MCLDCGSQKTKHQHPQTHFSFVLNYPQSTKSYLQQSKGNFCVPFWLAKMAKLTKNKKGFRFFCWIIFWTH
jgi:hypothetical protein